MEAVFERPCASQPSASTRRYVTVARSAKISGEETRLGAPAPAGCHGLGLGLGLGLGSVRRKIAASGKEIDKPELGTLL
jgi:hypothetical protein